MMTITTTNNSVKKEISLEELIKIFPENKKLKRASVLQFFDDGEKQYGSFVETLDETYTRLILFGEEVDIFLRNDNKVVIKIECRDCMISSLLQPL